jgi:hypothetical protein
MYEDSKLQEAAHFLDQMEASLQDPKLFQFNLSAFLSAARSVAQYALKEARTKSTGQAWYEGLVARDEFIGFFASTRNANIHDQPVQLDGHVDVFAKDAANVWDREVVEKFDRDGNLVEVVEGQELNADLDAKWTADFVFVPHYKFADWLGNEEIPELCQRYIDALRTLVSDGRARGILSEPKHAA